MDTWFKAGKQPVLRSPIAPGKTKNQLSMTDQAPAVTVSTWRPL
jgi:hypothetical protein